MMSLLQYFYLIICTVMTQDFLFGLRFFRDSTKHFLRKLFRLLQFPKKSSGWTVVFTCMHDQIYLILFVYHCLIWTASVPTTVAQSHNSTTSPLHHAVSSDSKISTPIPIVPKLDFLPFGVFNKIFGLSPNFATPSQHKVSRIRKSVKPDLDFPNQPFFKFDNTFTFSPISKFEIATVRSVSSVENSGWHFSVNGNYQNNHNDKPVRDDITNFHRNLPPLDIPRWRNLGTPNFNVPRPSVNAGPAGSSAKYGGIGGAAGVGVLVASWFACCRKKSRNSRDAEANEDQQNDTSVSTARSQGPRASNRHVVDV
ncbi:uncharacterized protein LOC135137261 [Zophobas morio]|uniref:uncharacterized protein LOC135137261 n=1 Tax=Zophobas morio TaxID=2755281 RepID=UPI003083DE8E